MRYQHEVTFLVRDDPRVGMIRPWCWCSPAIGFGHGEDGRAFMVTIHDDADWLVTAFSDESGAAPC